MSTHVRVAGEQAAACPFIPFPDTEALNPQSAGATKALRSLTTKHAKRPLWTVVEVAGYLSVSERTVRDWVYRRAIPYRKVGAALRFCPDTIERWTLPASERT